MKYIIIIALAVGGFWFYNNQKDNNSGHVDASSLDRRVKKIAEANAKKPEKKVTTTDIQALSNAMSNTEDFSNKGYIIRLISLGMLAKKDYNSFRLFRKKMEVDNPDEEYFDFMEDDFPGVCSTCSGDGASKCIKCKGSGKCTNHMCKEGRIKYETFNGEFEDKACIICKGKAKCGSCGGSGVSRTACGSCKGTGSTSTSSSKAEKLYKQALKSAQ